MKALSTRVERFARKIEKTEKVADPAGDTLAKGLLAVSAEIRQLEDELASMKRRKDEAYTERNRVVAAFARLALHLGWRAGITKTAIEGWHPSWHNCVYIETPHGQVSWHYHDDHADLFSDLPAYKARFDGHTTTEKYQRLHELRYVSKARGGPE